VKGLLELSTIDLFLKKYGITRNKVATQNIKHKISNNALAQANLRPVETYSVKLILGLSEAVNEAPEKVMAQLLEIEKTQTNSESAQKKEAYQFGNIILEGILNTNRSTHEIRLVQYLGKRTLFCTYVSGVGAMNWSVSDYKEIAETLKIDDVDIRFRTSENDQFWDVSESYRY